MDLAIRLHDFGLLPEGSRKAFVSAVSAYAIDGEDLYAFEDTPLRNVFTEEEFQDLLQRARTELIPRLDDVRRDWQSNHQSDDSPENHMQPLLDSLSALKEALSDDEGAVRAVEHETERIEVWIAEQAPDDSDDEPRRSLAGDEAPDVVRKDLSIFEDVDA